MYVRVNCYRLMVDNCERANLFGGYHFRHFCQSHGCHGDRRQGKPEISGWSTFGKAWVASFLILIN